MRIRSTKDYSSAENCKSNARRIYKFERITKSHIPAENVPIRIDVPKGPSTSVIANESKTHLKRGRPLGSKDQNPRKRKIKCQDDTI